MKNEVKKTIPDLAVYTLYLVLLVSLVFSWRAVSSIAIGALILAGIIFHRESFKALIQGKTDRLFLLCCTLLFLLQLVALLYTTDTNQGWINVRIKAGILAVPLAIYLTCPGEEIKKKIFQAFCLMLFAACLYCLFVSYLHFLQSGDSSVFFYHDLVSALYQHAVYFSILLAIGLFHLLENLANYQILFPKSFTIALVVFFSGFLVLLSSKFVIAFYLFYLAWYFIRLLQKKKRNRLAVAGFLLCCGLSATLVFALKNPVRDRFTEIIKGDIGMVSQEKFDPGDYFNGLQFRLLQWRFVAEILTENKSWWLGVSPGDAQAELNAKYLSKNMYAGDPSRGDRGYLIYNTHNQFLETALQNGITGLIVVLLLCAALLGKIRQEKNPLAGSVTLLLLGWLFIESAFETQYGILIFMVFPPLIMKEKQKQKQKEEEEEQ